MARLKIDKYEVEAEVGMTLMEVIDDMYMQLTNDRNAVDRLLPRLCSHEALEPYAACRICLVEVEKNGWSKLETSCNYKIKKGEEITVYTNSPRVLKSRKINMELLLAKAPDSEVLKHIAFQMGVTKDERFKERGDKYLENCIDCGICTRACEEIVGKSAITMAGRGTEKHVTTPYGVSEDCIGCGLCYHLCPTDAIKMEEKDGKRIIWGKEFEMAECKNCGDTYATKEMIKFRKKLLKKANLPEDFFTKCTKCYDNSIKDVKLEINTEYVVDVLKNICKDCTRCVDACPKGLLSQTEDFNKKGFAAVRWDPIPRGIKKEDLGNLDLEKLACGGCQACNRTCPESALDVYITKKGKVKIIK